jgi:ribosomal protein S18 acetylase RimI-like enzyme
MNVSVRPAVLQGTPALAALFRREAEYQRTITKDFELEPGADWSAYVAMKIQRPNGTVLIAECKNATSELVPIGFIDIRIVQRHGAQTGQRSKSATNWRCLLRKTPVRASNPVVRPRSTGFIDDIFVEPDFRRQGVATQLLQGALKWFVQQGVSQVEAAIWSSNQASQDFFCKFGFAPARILMQKDI